MSFMGYSLYTIREMVGPSTPITEQTNLLILQVLDFHMPGQSIGN